VSLRTRGQTEYTLDGLDSCCEIIVDRWGISHIYAPTEREAWFAQGFNAARERLWQLDLWRRAGLGRLAEALGRAFVERDRAARLFLYRGPIEDEWAAYGCDLRSILDPFVEGINAFVRETVRRPHLLPAEFELLGCLPAEWSSEDILRIRSHGRYRNLRGEVARAQMLHRFGACAERLRVRLEPRTTLAVPEGLDLSLIDEDALAVYDLATAPAIAPAASHSGCAEGSNNWALAGSRTATGRPMLAKNALTSSPAPCRR